MSSMYHHIQRAPLCLVIYALAAGTLAAAWLPLPPAASYVCIGLAASLLLLAVSFHFLSVFDEGDRLRIQFGPVPLFATEIRYADMTEIKLDRTTLLEGWGIQLSHRGGWVWNIWGRDCVLIRHGNTTRVGTDDAENLLVLLAQKTGLEPADS